MYNFVDYIIPISNYGYGTSSLTVIVVVSPGPVKVYDEPGAAGVLPPGSLTAYEASNVHLAQVAPVAADGENPAVARSLIDAGVSGESAGLLIETAPPEVKAASHVPAR